LDKVTEVASGIQSYYKGCEQFLPINISNRSHYLQAYSIYPHLDKVTEVVSGIQSDYK